MKRLIYTSIAAPGTTYETLRAILDVSVQANLLHSITGMLIFDGVHFMQCIEGPPDAIDQLMNNIQADQRHTDIVVVGTEMTGSRLFPHWNMGYLNRERPIREMLQRYTGDETFRPELLDMKKATSILQELSYIV